MDPQTFRKIMGSFPTGVTLVTGRSAEGEPFGLTANSFTSVSLSPFLVSVCVGRSSDTLSRFLDARAFAVNILAAGDEELALRFASSDREARFATGSWRNEGTGSPVLEGALGWVDCRLWQSVDAGDHVILIGEVERGDRRDGEPLLYFRSAFRRMMP